MEDVGHLTGAEVLPVFDRPPVVEVVLSYEFQPIARFGAVDLSRLADRWSERYPQVVEQPPLPMNPPIGPGGTFPPMFISVGAPAIRLWLMTPDSSQLLQIQRDRLILNWRHAGDEPYPHYETLRPEFVRALDDLASFLRDRGLGRTVPAAAEVSYVNEVLGTDNLAQILRASEDPPNHLGSPAAVRLQEVRAARSSSPDLPATLTLIADTQGRGPESTLITLTYRAALPLDSSEGGVMAAMDLGHRDVVLTFAEMTREEMHRRWGRQA